MSFGDDTLDPSNYYDQLETEQGARIKTLEAEIADLKRQLAERVAEAVLAESEWYDKLLNGRVSEAELYMITGHLTANRAKLAEAKGLEAGNQPKKAG